MNQLARNLWIKSYPLSVLGTQHGRNVTFIRLASGRVIIHSTGPFTTRDVAQIRSLGTVSWLLEAMLLHDTYARAGRDLFSGTPFLAPPGFSEVVKFSTTPLLPAPPEWKGELEVFALEGIPRLKEHICLHVPTRTLIVADLLVNFAPDERGWDRFFHRWVAGFKRYPGMSRIFRICIRDRPAFRKSLEPIMDADFDRIIVGHGAVIERDGRALFARGIADAGLD